MSDFRKPRTDNPIVPQSALFRKVVKAPKKPKGRRGRKPKGKKSGNFVSRQDPNFILRKEEEELRRAREDRQRKSQTQESLVQLQIEDIRDRREDRAGQLQIAQDRFALDAAEGRQQLRLQGEENQRTERYRAAKLTQGANQGAARAAEAVRAQQDSMDIYTQLRQQHRLQERRKGENREVMRNLLEGSRDRRPEDIDPRQFFESDLSVELGVDKERERETTALTFSEFAPRATPEQRRQRRKKVSNKESDDINSSVEEVFSRAGRKQTSAEISGKGKFLRGKTAPPDKFGEFATQSEIDRELATTSGSEPEPVAPKVSSRTQEELVFEGEDLLRRAYQTEEPEVYRPQVKTLKQVRKDNPIKDYRG